MSTSDAFPRGNYFLIKNAFLTRWGGESDRPKKDSVLIRTRAFGLKRARRRLARKRGAEARRTSERRFAAVPSERQFSSLPLAIPPGDSGLITNSLRREYKTPSVLPRSPQPGEDKAVNFRLRPSALCVCV